MDMPSRLFRKARLCLRQWNPTLEILRAVKLAVSNACARLKAKDEDVALILPDPVIRVFVQHFDEFPRSAQEAEPMLRWKLKKSVPFEVDETLISFMRQSPREDGVDIVTALSRLRIVREYESLAETQELRPGRGSELVTRRHYLAG